MMRNQRVEGRSTRHRMSALLGALTVGVLAIGGATAAADQPAPPLPNPGLDVSCGIKVAVVLDESGSIGGYFGPTDPNRADYTPQVRDAFRKLVGALAGTGSTMMVTEFADNGNTAVNPTPIDGNERVFENYITTDYFPRLRGLTGEYHTNWEAGLEEVRNSVQSRSFVPDLVIMLTDGEANKRYPWPGAPFSGGPVAEVAEDRAGSTGLLSPVDTSPAVDEAVDEANYLKGRGTRLFGVGINLKDEGTHSMARVAGATEWNGDPATLATSDYVTYSDATQLDNALALIGSQACSTGVTVNKQELQGDRLTPGAGWDFTVTPAEVPVRWLVPTTGAPATRTLRTTDDGRAAFTWVTRRVTSGITVVEAQRPGWSLGSVDCSVTASDGSRAAIAHTLVTGGFTLQNVDVGSKVSCNVVNVSDGSTPVTVPPTAGPTTTTVPGRSTTTTTTPRSATTTTVVDAPDDETDDSADESASGGLTEVAGTSTSRLRPVEVLTAVATPGLALTGAELPLPLAAALLAVGVVLLVLGRRARRR